MKKIIYHSNFAEVAENEGTEFQLYSDDSKSDGNFVRAKIDGKWKESYAITIKFIKYFLLNEYLRNRKDIVEII